MVFSDLYTRSFLFRYRLGCANSFNSPILDSSSSRLYYSNYPIPSGYKGGYNLVALVSNYSVNSKVLFRVFYINSKDLEAFRFLILDKLDNKTIRVIIRLLDKTYIGILQL